MYDPGDVVLAEVPFVDDNSVKRRPALVLFQEFQNIIIAGITSNLNRNGIPLTVDEGAVKDSVIKLDYIFTISPTNIVKLLFKLSKEKKKIVYDQLKEKLNQLTF